MKPFLRDLIWILPVSLGAGLALALFGQGTWWIGWLAYILVLGSGLLALAGIWRSSGAPRTLMVMLLLALFIRLGLGVAFSYILPAYGNDTLVNRSGYVFRDAYTYDNEAWELASSGDPLWKAFDRSYGTEDQYGGLLFFHSLFYRYLSPDAHRPWLMVLLSALAGALSAGLAWQGTRRMWGEPAATVVGWIMALYPESLLVGSSQTREPFLLLFTAMAFRGVAGWHSGHQRTAWFWMGGSLIGMLLFSPGVALATLVVLGIWLWLTSRERRIHWGWLVAGAVIVVTGLVFLGMLMGDTLQAPAGPLANLVDWLRYSANYGAHMTWLNSGQIQSLFERIPEFLNMPFIIAYGVLQPMLPATFVDPAVWPMRVIGILRGLGWYTLLPLLLYSLRPVLKTAARREKAAWVWLWMAVWFWILLCSFRAGGDQWDNPRYRLLQLVFQSTLAAYCLSWARQTGDAWLERFLVLDGIFVAVVTVWYISRYDARPGIIPLDLSCWR